MRNVCLFFQIHQPIRLRTYRFFDIGLHHNYYDDIRNRTLLKKAINRCYLPMNEILMDLISEYGDKMKICMSISGPTLEQLQWSAPEMIDSFKKLIDTGSVEILGETYNNSFNGLLQNKTLFKDSVRKHNRLLKGLFNVKPKVFKNTDLLFSDDIVESVLSLGFEGQIIEGARHILGWKSPDFLYGSGVNPRLKLLNRNHNLSDDISFRFEDKNWDQYPLTAEKYLYWIDKNFEVSNGDFTLLGMEYETFGMIHKPNTGIHEFIKELLRTLAVSEDYNLVTASDIIKEYNPIGQIYIPDPITWADEEKDVNTWLGNDLQKDAFNQLYELSKIVKKCKDKEITKDFNFLQDADHLLFMCTKIISDYNKKRQTQSQYDSPYNAYINYMNVISDLKIRINELLEKETNEK